MGPTLTISPNAALLEETNVLKETAAREGVEEPAPPAVTPEGKAEKEESVEVETVAEPPHSEATVLNEKVEATEEEEEVEEEEEEVVILTDESKAEEEPEAVAEVTKEESDSPDESLAPEADAPATEEAKEEDEKKEAPAEKTE
ncbi:hypothetical protein SDJN02_26786, partial [Cucurbita argyrosperma subsp. argyrosperma]